MKFPLCPHRTPNNTLSELAIILIGSFKKHEAVIIDSLSKNLIAANLSR